MLSLTASLTAQWPLHMPPGVPMGPDGKPNLSAPTPRTAEGKPDFTGVWENTWTVRFRNLPVQASPTPNSPPVATFGDVGAAIPGGLPFQPWAAELARARKESNAKDNPDAYCLPMGLMQFHLHPQPRKVIQTPTVIVIVYEGNAGTRLIYMDGRTLPKNDPQPWWYGYSVGRWEGDTLVVESASFRDGGWLDIYGSPLTDQGKMTERWRRVNYGILEIDVTIDDPKAYTKPFTVRVDQRIMPDSELIEFVCAENERSTKHMVGK
jgi:hypothetical protein